METLKKIVKISMLEKHFGSLRGLPVTQPVIVEKMERAKVAPAFYFDHTLTQLPISLYYRHISEPLFTFRFSLGVKISAFWLGVF